MKPAADSAGDAAVIGAGTSADDRVGRGSATGPGEAILRVGLVRSGIAHSTPAMPAASRLP